MWRIIAGIAKRWGPQKVKQRIWNAEFASGQWDYLSTFNLKTTGAKDPLYLFLDKYCAGAAVLDLGCGSGHTVLDMTDAFREYVGACTARKKAISAHVGAFQSRAEVSLTMGVPIPSMAGFGKLYVVPPLGRKARVPSKLKKKDISCRSTGRA